MMMGMRVMMITVSVIMITIVIIIMTIDITIAIVLFVAVLGPPVVAYLNLHHDRNSP